jgi:hypothetical protein
MARDLYGELLARALQRQAPPGHFPAFVTPGEANLLRSRGGGVPPGGGQYMAGGLPAFFSPADPDPATVGGDIGDPTGTGIGTGMGSEQGGATGEGDEFGGSSFGGAGATGEGDETANEGMVAAAAAADAANAVAAAQAQAAATAAAEASIAEQDAIAMAQAQDAAAQAEADDALAATLETFANITPVEEGETELDADAAVDVQTEEEAAQAEDSLLANLQTYANIAQAEQAQAMPGNLSADLGAANAALADAIAGVATGSATGGGTVAPGDFASLMPSHMPAMPGQPTPVADDAMANAIAQGMMDVDVPTGVGVAHDAQGQSIEQQLAEILQTTPYPTPVDPNVGHVADAIALANTATSLAMSEQEAADAHQEAVTTLGQDIDIDPDTGMNRGGIGSRSPGAMWGVNAEVANEDKSNISIAQIQALNAEDAQGYAINNPNPSEASLRASMVFAELNPTITNAIIGVMGLMPGSIGFASFLVGLITDKGLLNIPAVRAIPGVQALSDILDIPSSLVSVVTDPFADLLSRAVTGGGEIIGEALSQGEKALQDALRGIIDFDEDFEEPDGFADGEETFGGEPEIEFVPPVTTEASADAEPAPPARRFAEVDEATMRRIRANIIGGLRRTGRPTEGVTAFGPLFT